LKWKMAYSRRSRRTPPRAHNSPVPPILKSGTALTCRSPCGPCRPVDLATQDPRPINRWRSRKGAPDLRPGTGQTSPEPSPGITVHSRRVVHFRYFISITSMTNLSTVRKRRSM
jgi:hypothetical protein